MLIREITIKKPEGLNALNAAMLVQLACNYSSSVMIRRSSVFINAKSMMGAAMNTVLTFEVDGADERKAMRAIDEFLSA